MARHVSVVLLGLLLTCLAVKAFYLPGLAPTDFCTKEDKESAAAKNKQCKVSFKRREGEGSLGGA